MVHSMNFMFHWWDLLTTSFTWNCKCLTHQRISAESTLLLLLMMIKFTLTLNKSSRCREMPKNCSKNSTKLVSRRSVYLKNLKTRLKWLSSQRNMSKWKSRENCFQNAHFYWIVKPQLTPYNIWFSALVVSILPRTNMKNLKNLVKPQKLLIMWWIDH